MSVKTPSTPLIRTFAPALAILVFYLAVMAIPQRREIGRLEIELEQSAVELTSLEEKNAVQLRNYEKSQTFVVSNASTATYPNQHNLAVDDNPKSTRVQRFGQVIQVFQTHNVRCRSAVPQSEQRNDGVNRSLHHLSLTGTYHAMRASIEQIEAEAPQAAIAMIEMKRTLQSNECEWEIVVEIREDRR